MELICALHTTAILSRADPAVRQDIGVPHHVATMRVHFPDLPATRSPSGKRDAERARGNARGSPSPEQRRKHSNTGVGKAEAPHRQANTPGGALRGRVGPYRLTSRG